MCGKFVTKEKSQVKWLGQILSSLGIADSVLQTVITREGKIRGACLEIAVIVNDWRAEILGGMETALMHTKHATWGRNMGRNEPSYRTNSIQSWFVRLIYQVG